MEACLRPAVLVSLLTLLALGFHGKPCTTRARLLLEDSQIQLAQTALSKSLASARSTSALVSRLSASGGLKPREAAAVRDCMETMAASVDELQSSMKAMKSITGGKDFRLKMDNVQTWVSAALTNEDTCMDGFAGNAMNGDVKSTIRSHIVTVARLTSNALAVINGLATSPTPS